MVLSIIQAPSVEMTDFKDLFIEMTAKNCNLSCKHCYLDFNPYKKVEDYISIDKIKEAFYDLKNENIQMVHLTGGEPFLHPNFNNILRLCLKFYSVTLHTNGIVLNEKKVRFLRKVEDEGLNEIFFRIGLVSYDERLNDDIRGRGSFRKAIFAYQSLLRYYFAPEFVFVNYYNNTEEEIRNGFIEVFTQYEIPIDDLNLKVIPFIDKELVEIDNFQIKSMNSDCMTSRILTAKGVYNCPLVSKDDRGRSGGTFKDYSRKSHVETSLCIQCAKSNFKLFS